MLLVAYALRLFILLVSILEICSRRLVTDYFQGLDQQQMTRHFAFDSKTHGSTSLQKRCWRHCIRQDWHLSIASFTLPWRLELGSLASQMSDFSHVFIQRSLRGGFRGICMWGKAKMLALCISQCPIILLCDGSSSGFVQQQRIKKRLLLPQQTACSLDLQGLLL